MTPLLLSGVLRRRTPHSPKEPRSSADKGCDSGNRLQGTAWKTQLTLS